MYMLTHAMNRKEPVFYDYKTGTMLVIRDYPLLKEDEGLVVISNGDNKEWCEIAEKEEITASELIPVGIIKLNQIEKIKSQLIIVGELNENASDTEFLHYMLKKFIDDNTLSDMSPDQLVKTINLI